MKAAYIDYQDTHSFSKLLLSYLDEKQDVSSFYGNKPTFEGFEKQIKTKAAFAHREAMATTQLRIVPLPVELIREGSMLFVKPRREV